MSRRTHVKDDNNVDIRFANWYKMMVDLIAPKNFFGVAGRGTAKTTDILADRSLRIGEDMPGAYFAWAADTYINALKNIIPSLLEGWNRKGFRENYDYVVDKPPLTHFKLPYKQPETYKHTISTRYGNLIKLVSMDVVASGAGDSYQHEFGDEGKYLDFQKLKKLMPALRGYPAFGHSIFYRGMTFTTDMPNIIEGEYDWILEREKDMDVAQMKLILKTSIIVNDLRAELYNAVRNKDVTKVKSLQRNLVRWLVRNYKIRKDSTLFYMVSSYANVDILSPGYFTDSLEALGKDEFKTSIITLSPTLEIGEKFYPNLTEENFFDDGTDASFYDRYSIGDMPEASSLALRYINHSMPIEAGVDFGDQLSMVTGQSNTEAIRMLKNFWTLPPESTPQLAKQFTDFYKYHKYKKLDLYYDRSGNQYSQIKRDWATELQGEIKKADSSWSVDLKSINQGTIFQEEEYKLLKVLLAGINPNLPKVLIDKFNCRELKSSMELAKVKIIKNTRTGGSTIAKDKSSEAIAYKRRPMLSTNMSDAGKYFFCRPAWMRIASQRRRTSHSAPEVIR